MVAKPERRIFLAIRISDKVSFKFAGYKKMLISRNHNRGKPFIDSSLFETLNYQLALVIRLGLHQQLFGYIIEFLDVHFSS